VIGVWVTVFTTANVVDEALAVGVRTSLPKPVDFEVLPPVVEVVVGNAA
jgi:DNA-binding NarL/FixJ family response regulator